MIFWIRQPEIFRFEKTKSKRKVALFGDHFSIEGHPGIGNRRPLHTGFDDPGDHVGNREDRHSLHLRMLNRIGDDQIDDRGLGQ